MDTQEQNMVYKLHLKYTIAIASLIIGAMVICWCISSKSGVSSAAFQNFSFAATIVSIVLAVVSIIYSIYSGAGMSGSVGVMQSAEEEIRKQVVALQDIDKRIVTAVKEGNSILEEKVDSVAQQIQPYQVGFFQATSSKEKDDTAVFDFEHTSLLGLYAIYACLKWNETKKNWPLDILGNENRLYIHGYLVALSSIPSIKFIYRVSTDSAVVEYCEFGEDGLSITIDQLLELMKTYDFDKDMHAKFIQTIDDYFKS